MKVSSSSPDCYSCSKESEWKYPWTEMNQIWKCQIWACYMMIVPIKCPAFGKWMFASHQFSWRRKRAETNWRREVEGLTRPAMGVWSLLIFFTDPGLIELNNLSRKEREENIWAMADHKKMLRQSDIRARRRKWNCGCLFREKKRNKHRKSFESFPQRRVEGLWQNRF